MPQEQRFLPSSFLKVQVASTIMAILAEQNLVEMGSTLSAQCWHQYQSNLAGRI